MSKLELPVQLVDPDHKITALDIEKSHRLFLARDPDTLSAVPDTVGYPFTFAIAAFLVSDEFKAKIRLVDGQASISEIMLARLDTDILEWVAAITDPRVMRSGDARDRLSVVRKFLTDDRTREAVAAIGLQHVHEIDAINAALAQLDDVARTIGASGLFDEAYYRSQLFAGGRIADAAAHYVLHGERMGFKPSPNFDPATYSELNPDLPAANFNRLFHYAAWGRNEGRAHLRWPAHHPMPTPVQDSGRPTVLLVLHEASYTGAPILGWNLARALSERCDIVVVLRSGGALEAALHDVAVAVVPPPPYETTLDPSQMDRFADRLVEVYRPLYAIANSVESRAIAMALRRHDVPIVALVHEFWPGAQPGVRLDFYEHCSSLIFPAQIVEQSSFHAFREIRLQNRVILPQGPCVVPPLDPAVAMRSVGPPFVTAEDGPVPLAMLLGDGRRGDGPFTVIGLGAVEMRKGIDVFISTAIALQTTHPDLAFRFIWIGTWEHAVGSQYAALLAEQYTRSGLGDRLHFFPAVDDLEPIYARADALLLSSRLDPLPNVTIDAAFRGIPAVCFDRASGMAELLAADVDTANLVVPYLDSGAAAARIAALARDPGLWTYCSEAMRRLAQGTFDMSAYARAIDEIGHSAARKFENSDSDRRLIDSADAFDPLLYFGPDTVESFGQKPMSAVYLARTRHLNFSSAPVIGVPLRRPMAGFHPFSYGNQSSDFPRDGSRDPLAHFIEQGMPEGRWSHQVLRPDLTAAADDPAGDASNPEAEGRPAESDRSPLPVALHGHFHYADHIGDFMTAIAANRLRADLFLTTTSAETAEILRAATSGYEGGKVMVEVGPNIGRDIYAFLRVLHDHVQGRYDVVGHVHGKRSLDALDLDPDFGDRWRRFLWAHLLGPRYGVADFIVETMRRDATLGLVFPENAVLTGWEKNVESAPALAQRLGLHGALPDYIEFPAGTMFWARVDALDALVQANLRQDEMPVEPIPIDGTVLHALERMLPLVIEQAGYRYATTYIPDMGR